MAGARQSLDELGKRILNQSRTELFMSMRFMARALESLGYELDLRTQRIGTEGEKIHFNPEFLFQLFMESPQKLNRLYLHLILHCLFRHPYSGDEKEEELWNLACDIHVESVLDSMDYDLIRRPPGEFRQRMYEEFTEKCRVLTAERLYQLFLRERPGIERIWELQREFTKDDHQYWKNMGEQGEQDIPDMDMPDVESPDMPDSKDSEDSPEEKKDSDPDASSGGGSESDKREQSETEKKPEREYPNRQNPDLQKKRAAKSAALDKDWEEKGKRLKAELSTLGSEASSELGSLSWQIALQYKNYTDFRDFLRYLMVEREELQIDPDSFDFGFYNYGMELYGNMPLLEENEYQESRKVEKLVIAIDTSASCKDGLVQKFLNQTAGMLSDEQGFFKRMEVHILECDDRVQQDILIRSREEMESYSKSFSLKGGYGTDFRPVFREVERMERSGELTGLRGLLYFTDGYGEYPEKPTRYRTGFVFPREEDFTDAKVPGWALSLYI